MTNHHLLLSTLTLSTLTLLATSCAVEPDDSDPLSDASEEVIRLPAPGSKSDLGNVGEVTPGIRWLSRRSESELAHLFAAGRASHIPLGEARQQPLVSWYAAGLVPLVQVLFQGTLWQQSGVDDDGHPLVDVYSTYLDWHGDSVVAPYAGVASLSTVADLLPISGALPPTGTVWPHWLSPYWEPIEIDDQPSVFVDYQGESKPILGRAIDEFRELAPESCPGLYLVRTHYLRNRYTSSWSFLFYLAADFGPSDRECDLDGLL